MALMMKVRIEEDKRELNIVIWNEEDDEVKSVENPIVNLKIPLKTSNKEISVKKNVREGFQVQKTSPRHNSELINGVSEFSSSAHCVDGNFEENIVNNNAYTPTLENEVSDSESTLHEVNHGVSEKTKNGENASGRSLIDSVLDHEDEGEDLSFSSYLEYIKKKSEAFEKREHELCMPQNTTEILDSKQNNGFPECNLSQIMGNEPSQQSTNATAKKKATDTMSVTSDDYTLMIDDDTAEKKDIRLNISDQNKSFTNVSSKRESSPLQSCDKGLARRKSRRQQHMIAVHELKFACPVCGLMFSLRRQLLLHLRVHGLKNPSANSPRPSAYSCPQCNRKYKCPKALKEHSRSHAPIQSRFFWRVSKMNVSIPEKPKMKAPASTVSSDTN